MKSINRVQYFSSFKLSFVVKLEQIKIKLYYCFSFTKVGQKNIIRAYRALWYRVGKCASMYEYVFRSGGLSTNF